MTRAVNHPFYLALRGILKFFIRGVLFIKGFRVVGGAHVPRKRKPCILICNHAAFIDSVYLICAVRPRFTICGARPKYFKNPLLRFVFRTANILKVENRDQFLEDCGRLLDGGEILLIYPEMGRNPEGIGIFKTWAAEVSLAQRAPVVPCCLYGTTKGQEGPKRLYAGQEVPPHGSAEELTRTYREAVLGLAADKEKAGRP